MTLNWGLLTLPDSQLPPSTPDGPWLVLLAKNYLVTLSGPSLEVWL